MKRELWLEADKKIQKLVAGGMSKKEAVRSLSLNYFSYGSFKKRERELAGVKSSPRVTKKVKGDSGFVQFSRAGDSFVHVGGVKVEVKLPSGICISCMLADLKPVLAAVV